MTVTPLGVDGAFVSDGSGPPCDCRRRGPPFLLHVGDLHERRNLPMLIDAVLVGAARIGALPTLSLCWSAPTWVW